MNDSLCVRALGCAYVTKAHRLDSYRRRQDLCVCMCVCVFDYCSNSAPQISPYFSFYLRFYDDIDDGVGGGEDSGHIFFCLFPLPAKRETLPDAHRIAAYSRRATALPPEMEEVKVEL